MPWVAAVRSAPATRPDAATPRACSESNSAITIDRLLSVAYRHQVTIFYANYLLFLHSGYFNSVQSLLDHSFLRELASFDSIQTPNTVWRSVYVPTSLLDHRFLRELARKANEHSHSIKFVDNGGKTDCETGLESKDTLLDSRSLTITRKMRAAF